MQAIEGYDIHNHTYYVSQTGNIYYKKADDFYQPVRVRKDPRAGYMTVKLYKDKGRSFSKLAVHKLVAKHFIPNPDNYTFVRHKDGDVTNNDHQNLEWHKCNHNKVLSTA